MQVALLSLPVLVTQHLEDGGRWVATLAFQFLLSVPVSESVPLNTSIKNNLIFLSPHVSILPHFPPKRLWSQEL
jgi:hypothetical protein